MEYLRRRFLCLAPVITSESADESSKLEFLVKFSEDLCFYIPFENKIPIENKISFKNKFLYENYVVKDMKGLRETSLALHQILDSDFY